MRILKHRLTVLAVRQAPVKRYINFVNVRKGGDAICCRALIPIVAHRDLASRIHVRNDAERWGNRPASLWIAEDFGCCAQADGETRSVVTASSIRRRSAAWAILLDWTFRSMRRVSALWMTQAGSCGK